MERCQLVELENTKTSTIYPKNLPGHRYRCASCGWLNTNLASKIAK